ncbi:MAG: hypothetical protein IJX25_00855 [Clostridia bacterium]|nr:hypothetical protein [Clostridia bacterium]
MDKTLLELLTKFMGSQSQNQFSQPAPPNPSASSYPPEALKQPQNAGQQSQSMQNNNILGMFSQLLSGGNNSIASLLSLLGKDNPLASIISGDNKKEEERPSSPKDEILL